MPGKASSALSIWAIRSSFRVAWPATPFCGFKSTRHFQPLLNGLWIGAHHRAAPPARSRVRPSGMVRRAARAPVGRPLNLGCGRCREAR